MHPELRARLAKLGLAASTDDCEPPEEGLDGSTGDESSCGKQAGGKELDQSLQEKEGPSGGLDSSIDNLLLQMDDLDERAEALKREAKRDGQGSQDLKAWVKTQRGKERSASANAKDERLEADKKGAYPSASEQSLGEGIARQHPLQGVGLADAEKDFRRGGARRKERPPLPHTPAGTRPGRVQLAASTANLRASSVSVATPSSADKRSAGGSCSLPPLKPSASAPGCLLSGPWHREAR
mmetsp:Transcript_1463/g.2924  ORF Transcript_1463/g.2924 Transcript_1463/m.2924 type:complete len:239 (+) Transcript_1463:287-1003(+)